MDLRNKLYQMFVLAPNSVASEEDENLKIALGRGLGGVIFFTKNIQSIEQTKAYTSAIKDCALFAPFLGIDEEGGRVERTENIFGGKKFLSARYQAQKGLDFVKEQTQEIAQLLNELGFNMNFAPVLDVDTNPDNPIIAERAYSNTPDEVSKYAIAAMKVYLENGIIPVGKHFPGHGDVNADSHLTLPVLELGMAEVEKVHIKPFKDAIEQGIPAIMAAHLFCPCFDKEKIPSSLSSNVMGYLRNKLNFDGIIVSDDMQMGGVAMYEPKDAILAGIKAGINLFLFRDSCDDKLETIEQVYSYVKKDESLAMAVNSSYNRILKLKSRFMQGLFYSF